jgi:ACS family hexuronate transporter-like MFS transporter
MPQINPDRSSPSSAWKWWVCGLLLLATMINYMDRLTINQTAKHIKDEVRINNEEYGEIERAFGIAFALGSLAFGWMVDRWNVRWVYPAALLGWSVAGFLTGYVQTFLGLLLCRFVLGLFEAGNWPCGLRTTQRILRPDQRTLGNAILQSGAAIGAVFTPLIVQALVSGKGTWPYPFRVVGALGAGWVLLWVATVRREDLALPRTDDGSPSSAAAPYESLRGPAFIRIYADRRFLACLVMAVTINLTWHFFRVWLPLFLQEDRGFSESEVNYFTAAYYLATDAGSLTTGFGTLLLARRGMTVHRSRLLMFLLCMALTLFSLAVLLPLSRVLLCGLLLTVGFGALGLFPIYYTFTQELTVRHQGKVNGLLGCLTWVATGLMHPLVGQWLDRTRDYSTVVAFAGLVPVIGFLALIVLWKDPNGRSVDSAALSPLSGAEEGGHRL